MVASDQEEEKKSDDSDEEQERDYIQIIEQSEHLYMSYAQKKLYENKRVLDERAKQQEN